VFTTDVSNFVSGFGLAQALPVVLPTSLLFGDSVSQPYLVVDIQFFSAEQSLDSCEQFHRAHCLE
jgi:hypothetical protein